MSLHRQRLIDEAERLFRANGFHAVSLDSILRAASTTKTTFYKHFESKDQLALICLRNRREAFWAWLDQRMEETGAVDPICRIHGFFRLLGEYLEQESDSVLPFFAACGEFPHPKDPCNIAGREALREIEVRLLKWVRDAGVAEPDRLGSQLAVTAQGAILHEVANRGGRSAGIAGEMAASLMDQHFEPAGA